MSKILSQDEIDALLRSAQAIERATTGAARPAIDGVTPYNFRRPERVSKEQFKSLHFLHDRFARNVATSLSAYLRTVTDVSLSSVEQSTYGEFLRALPDPTAFYALTLTPLDLVAAFELNPSVAFSMIDRMLGGVGRNVTLARALTEIEQNVIDAVVRLVIDTLTETWRSIVDIRFALSGRETRPQMLQVAAPNEVVVHLSFDIRIGEARGMLNLAITASALEAVGASFVQSWERARREPTAVDRRSLFLNLGRASVPVSASVETALSARELLAIRPGDVLTLGRSVRDSVDVQVRGTTKFAGRLVAHGGCAGVLLTVSEGQAAGSEA